MRTASERFWSKVHKSEACWLWTAGTSHDGYGRFSVKGRNVYAHRWSYQVLVGPIPGGLEIDHLCRVHACVNPDHLEVVTRRENQLRGAGLAALCAQRTHCPKGHEYSGANTYRHKGSRYCRECNRANAQRWRAARAL